MSESPPQIIHLSLLGLMLQRHFYNYIGQSILKTMKIKSFFKNYRIPNNKILIFSLLVIIKFIYLLKGSEFMNNDVFLTKRQTSSLF